VIAVTLPAQSADGEQSDASEPVIPEVQIVVTASRLPEPVERVPAHVTVIDRAKIETSTARTVAGILDEVAGLAVRTYSGSGTDAQLRARGYGTGHVQVLLDGRPINPPDLDRINWLAVPLAAVERIEVVRGGASAVHGTNAVAATVNIITRGPSSGDGAPALEAEPRVSLGVEGYLGSFGTAGGEAYAASTAGPLAVSGAYTQTTTDGQRERSAADAQSLQLAFGLIPGGADPSEAAGVFDMETRLQYSSSARQFPGELTGEQFEDDPDQSAYPADGATTTSYGVLLTPSWNTGGVTVTSPAGFSSDRTETDFTTFGSFFDTAIAQVDLRPAVSATLLPEGDVALELEAAGDAVLTRLDYTTYATATREDSTREVRLDELAGGLGLGAELSVSRLVYLTTRGRAELRHVASSSDDVDAVEGDVRQRGIGAQAGLVVRPAEELRLFLRYDRVYRYPLLDEQVSFQGFGDELYAGLDPERGDSFDLGMEVEPAEVLRVAVSGYYLAMEDEIVFVAGEGQQNLEETERLGADLEASLNADEVLTVDGAYSYILARYAAGPNDGNRIAGVPTHAVRVGARIALPAGLVVEPSYEFTSEYYLDAENDVDPDFARTRVSAYLSWYPVAVLENARLYAGVENILDDRNPSLATYSSVSGTTTLYPENGRSYHAGFSWRY
jgi:outer membrane receptor protein involved in Fe transport